MGFADPCRTQKDKLSKSLLITQLFVLKKSLHSYGNFSYSFKLNFIYYRCPSFLLFTSTPILQETSASKYDFLYEATHVLKANQVEDSHFPLLNSYKIFKKSSISFTTIVKKLVSQKVQVPKEYILSTKINQCILPSNPQKHFDIIKIPSEFSSKWIK